jgi:3-hydroxy-9,10-secoandrosta-1,3,5(10)-triene-9,17-dione monooxygenase reductase component
MIDYTKLDIPQQIQSDILPSLDATHYRQVLSHFATGVTVITSRYHSQPAGFTANSFCSVSLEPMLVSFCVSNSSAVWPLIKAAGTFCVNILSEDQKGICATFARKGVDRFAQTSYRLSSLGTPILDGVLAWIECSIATILPAGDHVIVLGQVHNLEHAATGNPLVWSKGKFGTFTG